MVHRWKVFMKELKKILYAEDEHDLQTIVEISFWSTSNYEIKICDNGKLLLDCVEDYNPDLILLDAMMPEMDGITTLKNLQLNEKTRHIPVIFITAKAQTHEVKLFNESGVIGVITKPFNPMQLCSDIKELWDKNVNEKVNS